MGIKIKYDLYLHYQTNSGFLEQPGFFQSYESVRKLGKKLKVGNERVLIVGIEQYSKLEKTFFEQTVLHVVFLRVILSVKIKLFNF